MEGLGASHRHRHKAHHSQTSTSVSDKPGSEDLMKNKRDSMESPQNAQNSEWDRNGTVGDSTAKERKGKTKKRKCSGHEGGGDDSKHKSKRTKVEVPICEEQPNEKQQIEKEDTKPPQEKRSKSYGRVVTKETAMEYLHSWDKNRSSWSFKKKMQYWLLQNMYEKDQVSSLTPPPPPPPPH